MTRYPERVARVESMWSSLRMPADEGFEVIGRSRDVDSLCRQAIGMPGYRTRIRCVTTEGPGGKPGRKHREAVMYVLLAKAMQ